MPLNCDKALPELPTQRTGADNASGPRSTFESASDTNKTLPIINIENKISAEEMDRLHDLWNETSAAAPPAEATSPLSNPRAGYCKRANQCFFRPHDDSSVNEWLSTTLRLLQHKADAKATNALQSIRSKAQQRLMNKLKYAKSTPNLSGKDTAAVKAEARIAPNPSKLTLPPKLAPVIRDEASKGEPAPKPEASSPLEELDVNVSDGGIYLTFDPEWRTSSGDVLLTFITPIAQEPLARPDSPLLHRHRSLCELTTHFHFSGRHTESTRKQSADAALHPIDELHSYLEM
ncbi:hypothetical protein F5I97DRAFT_1830946 [Phlebopus sp. FC_14]|nr:hypothetical protein F5I97DRAFT_1830946 [Phlebopus sp. FC_14]